MIYRLYYWFNGASKNRPGGPWWYKDFHTEQNRENYLNDLISFIKHYAKTQSDMLPKHLNTMTIAPPESSIIHSTQQKKVITS